MKAHGGMQTNSNSNSRGLSREMCGVPEILIRGQEREIHSSKMRAFGVDGAVTVERVEGVEVGEDSLAAMVMAAAIGNRF